MDYAYDVEMINHLIRNRRSIFIGQFEPGKVIPDGILKEILENANWAPTHKLTQPWHFTVFTGEGLKKLADFQSRLYKRLSGDNFRDSKYRKLQEQPLGASHVIAIGMKRDAKERVPEIEEIEAVACAVQNMALTVAAYGLGCYWGSGGITYMEEAKSFFGLSGEDKLLGFLFLGYVAIPSTPREHIAVSEKVTWVK